MRAFLAILLAATAMIVTLATNGIIFGLMLLKFGQKFSESGRAPKGLQDLTNVNYGPINIMLLFAIAVSAVVAWYLNRTRFGRQVAAVGANGPFLVQGCEIPDTVAPAVADMLPYFQQQGTTAPALEFVSPIKGPAMGPAYSGSRRLVWLVGSGARDDPV